MKKFRTTFALLLLVSLLAALLGLAGAPSAHAASPSTGTLSGSFFTVNNGAGDQTDPHISGDWVSYTDNSTGTYQVRYHNAISGEDAAIPQPNGSQDTLSGISGSTVVYMQSTSTDQQIYRYDIGSGNPPVAVDPVPGALREEPAIGGQTVAWSDFTSDPAHPQLVVYNLATGVATTITNDPSLASLEAAVSPDGSVIVWIKCTGIFSNCNVWEAVLSGGTWTQNQLTSDGASEFPHSDGQVVVYDSVRNGEQDIYWQPVGGGAEQHISFAGPDEDAHISGNLIVFDHFDTTASIPNWNVYVYSLATQTLYQVTSALTNERLSDFSVGSDGVARVVWQVLESDYTVTASDPDNPSNQLTISCAPASGSIFPIGTTMVNCQASDPAGNTASGSFTVTVKGAAQQVNDLITLVNSFHLSSSLQNALDNKLQDVLAAINAGQTATACSELTDFIGFVQTHTGKGITQSQATQLVTAAQQIQAVLGC